jgi:phage terminase large subunit
MMNFSPKQFDFIKKLNTRLDFLEGTVRSGKSYVGVFKFFLKVRESEREEGINVMAAYDIKTFERVVLPLIRIHFPNTEYKSWGEGGARVLWNEEIIYVVGFADMNRFKRILGSNIKNFFATEINLLPHIYFLHEIIGRSSSVNNPYIYLDSNPDNPELEIYSILNQCRLMTDSPNKDYFNQTPDVDGWHAYHFVFEDNPIMDEDKIKRLKESIPEDSPYYAPKILGVRTKAEGLVFGEDLKDTHIITDAETQRYKYVATSVGVDTAYSAKTADTIAFAYLGFTDDKKMVVLDEWVHNNADFIIRASDIPRFLEDFIYKNNQKYGMPTYGSYVDSADANLINEINMSRNAIGASPAWKKFGIIDRIQWTLDALHNNAYLINENCAEHVKEMKNYMWNEKKSLTPMDKNDHTINAVQYAFIPYRHLVTKE